jgi:hypothetical protein
VARKKTATKRRRGLFLAKLRATGSVTAAADAGELVRSSWYRIKERDEEFSEAWDDAELAYLDGLEAVAIRRAVVGETESKPYTNYEKDGNKTTRFRDVVTKSDTLLLATLKARHPAYKEKKTLELTSPDGTLKQNTAVADYSNLTNEELRTLVELERKARGGETARA